MEKTGGLYKTVRIAGIKEEVRDFKTFSFEENHNINYKAGQYLTLVYHAYNEEIRRSYSITSSPVLNEPLSIGVKRVENGFFSRQLVDAAKQGDELITIGAGGFFTLPADIHSYKQIFFFAAGSGITPVYSLVKTALHAHPGLSLAIIYSNASAAKTVFFRELIQLKEKFPNRFHAEFLFSNTIDLSKARLHRELLLQFLTELAVADYSRSLFYICGPASYMRMCTYTLLETGVPAGNIKREDFVIDSVRRRDTSPPDAVSRKAVIKFNNSAYHVMINYPDSILQAAKKTGISLPYSCEAGRCGSCVAKCTKGNVWHSYNEVLTEKELKQGLILTCVGHPYGSDVEIEINSEQ
jgi:ring-1,2-phenylacetyl-CoA epoxidase subunit PaaE